MIFGTTKNDKSFRLCMLQKSVMSFRTKIQEVGTHTSRFRERLSSLLA
jgi:hypothetical protein